MGVAYTHFKDGLSHVQHVRFCMRGWPVCKGVPGHSGGRSVIFDAFREEVGYAVSNVDI